jgi:hypothetical protein
MNRAGRVVGVVIIGVTLLWIGALVNAVASTTDVLVVAFGLLAITFLIAFPFGLLSPWNFDAAVLETSIIRFLQETLEAQLGDRSS